MLSRRVSHFFQTTKAIQPLMARHSYLFESKQRNYSSNPVIQRDESALSPGPASAALLRSDLNKVSRPVNYSNLILGTLKNGILDFVRIRIETRTQVKKKKETN